MAAFVSDGLEIAFDIHGSGSPVLLIHGFGSSATVNWVQTGWVEVLSLAGWQPIMIDNRGHGASAKLYDPAAYPPWLMAGDAAALLDHLGIPRAPVIGYSMGARIAAFLCSRHPQRVSCSVWGGMGMNLITGLGDSEEIIAGLTARALSDVSSRTARQFRAFAERTGADRQALAACMVTSRAPMLEAEVRAIETPVLVVAGSGDDMAGPPDALAALLRNGEAAVVSDRDHMRTTGDPEFKRMALAFIERHALTSA